MTSIPPAAKKWGVPASATGGVVALLLWAMNAVQSESVAVRDKLDEVVESQREMTSSQKITNHTLKTYAEEQRAEAARAKEARDKLEARIEKLEARGRR